MVNQENPKEEIKLLSSEEKIKQSLREMNIILNDNDEFDENVERDDEDILNKFSAEESKLEDVEKENIKIEDAAADKNDCNDDLINKFSELECNADNVDLNLQKELIDDMLVPIVDENDEELSREDESDDGDDEDGWITPCKFYLFFVFIYNINQHFIILI